MSGLSLKGKRFFFVGIKGTGMCALAELFQKAGAFVCGADGFERFYTDDILKDLGIPVYEGMERLHLDSSFDEVVFSAAYTEKNSADLAEARRLNLPMLTYPQALGRLSRLQPSAAVSGVHGKTTTAALCASLAKAMDLDVSVLIGSAAADLNNRCTFTGGDRFFIAETCEYRRHFLSFSPTVMILTSVEEDHPDYFKNFDDIRSAFIELADRLPDDGTLIYCADDAGAAETAALIAERRPSLEQIPYGLKADGRFRIFDNEERLGVNRFRLSFDPTREWRLRLPGHHFILNAAAALAAVSVILRRLELPFDEPMREKAAAGLSAFAGCKRRTERIGEAGGVLFMDDYAHHPTAIQTTLLGYKTFFRPKRLIVDFMSHTYSRTERLLDEFASAFSAADIVVLNKIYASARETVGSVTGETLYEETKKRHPCVYYCPEFEDAENFLKTVLQPGDLFVTMGAGNNNIIGNNLYEFLKRNENS